MALALLATGARAEAPVGLEAQGVDPMAAVDNRLDLDVRDELGRPVSGRLVLAQLKSAAAVRAGTNAFSSRLPRAAAILPALEAAAGCAAWLARLAESAPSAVALASLPTPRPKVGAVLVLALGCVMAAAAASRVPRYEQVPVFLCTCRREILRC